jgi:uncharacterized protein YacL
MDELDRLEKISSVYAKRVEKGRKIIDRLFMLLKRKIQILSFVEPPKSIREHIKTLAKLTKSTIITLDVNLTDEARRRKIPVININELALAFRLQLVPGDILSLHLTRPGKEKTQAVGYLEDALLLEVVVDHDFLPPNPNSTLPLLENQYISLLLKTLSTIVVLLRLY